MPDQLIVVTGAGGYIARHIVAQVLESGRAVRATVRSDQGAKDLRAALAPRLAGSRGALEKLSTVELDMVRDEGWDAAMAGADALVHTASPFPLVQPKDARDLIRPAVEGTRRALAAATKAGVSRVVLTSSTAAICYGRLREGRTAFDEEDWTDPDAPGMTAYTRSKTLAEREAWRHARQDDPAMKLTVINPGLVVGPPLGSRHGSSLEVIERILSSRDPALPGISFPVVDVRDVALAHARALDRPETAGHRFLTAAETMSYVEIARAVQAAVPGRRIVTRKAPNWLIRVIGLFDPAVGTILPDLNRGNRVDSSRARMALGIDFADPRAAIAETVHYLDGRKAA